MLKWSQLIALRVQGSCCRSSALITAKTVADSVKGPTISGPISDLSTELISDYKAHFFTSEVAVDSASIRLIKIKK